MKSSGLMWDACGLVNLAATARADEILLALDCPCWVVREVREREVIYLRPMAQEIANDLEKIDVTPLLRNGLLREDSLTEAEQGTFVDLARELDDGEAMTLAAAIHRGCGLVTDDRVAKRVAKEHGVLILTTPEWLKSWVEATSASPEAIAEVLNQIAIRARFRPRLNDPLYRWWMEQK